MRVIIIIISMMLIAGCFIDIPPVPTYGNYTVKITYLMSNVSGCVENADWDLKNMNCANYTNNECRFIFNNCTAKRPATTRQCAT